MAALHRLRLIHTSMNAHTLTPFPATAPASAPASVSLARLCCWQGPLASDVLPLLDPDTLNKSLDAAAALTETAMLAPTKAGKSMAASFMTEAGLAADKPLNGLYGPQGRRGEDAPADQHSARWLHILRGTARFPSLHGWCVFP